jgi:hypothetical protein
MTVQTPTRHEGAHGGGYPRPLRGPARAPTDEQDRAQVKQLAAHVQHVTGDAVAPASVDQGDTGAQAAQDAEMHPRQLAVVKLSAAKPGCVLWPKR